MSLVAYDYSDAFAILRWKGREEEMLHRVDGSKYVLEEGTCAAESSGMRPASSVILYIIFPSGFLVSSDGHKELLPE